MTTWSPHPGIFCACNELVQQHHLIDHVFELGTVALSRQLLGDNETSECC